MEVVFNDYSLDSQFGSSDAFADSLTEYTLPLLEILKEGGSLILKKFQSYDLRVTQEMTLNDFLTSNQFMGYSESQKLRSLIVGLRDEPYWEENPKSDPSATYMTDYMGIFSGENPNCFSEAYERERMLLSVEHDDFKNESISVKKNDELANISNFYNKQSSLVALFRRNHISFSEFLFHLSDGIKVSFFKSGGEAYIDKEFKSLQLSGNDVFKIIEYYKRWLIGIRTGAMMAHLTDSIHHRGCTYSELRVTLDDKREFRLFYKQFGSQYVFFNMLLKDTPETPEQTKDKTYSLIKVFETLN